MRDIREAAQAKRLQLHILNASTDSEIDAAFATLVQQHAGALLIGGDQFFFTQREQLIALASRYAVPVIYEQRELAEAGGLIWNEAHGCVSGGRSIPWKDS
jgi:putative tryptophan/tyrosine transport system substrate-binding protein